MTDIPRLPMTQSEPVLAEFVPPVVLGDLCLRCAALLDPHRDFDNHGPCGRRQSEAEREYLGRAQPPVQPVLSGLDPVRLALEAMREAYGNGRLHRMAETALAALDDDRPCVGCGQPTRSRTDDGVPRHIDCPATAPAADEASHDDTPHFMGEFDLTPQSRTCALCLANPATPKPEQDR